jgi:wobble nucleotide-excising tRNase
MPITRIKRLRDCGVFHDYTWPAELADCARFNVLYGWNGSGKTTLGRLLRCLETKSPPASGQMAVTIDAHDVTNGNIDQVTLRIRVFNRDFVTDSVFPTAGDVAPIYVLGKENVEKQKLVAKLKKSLEKAQDKLTTERRGKSTADSALDKFCIDKAKAIKDTLRSSGVNPYNNYNKCDFTRRTETMKSAGDKEAHLLVDAARDKLLAQIRSSPKSKLSEVTYRLPDITSSNKSVAKLLETTVASSAIQSLKDNAEVSSWVYTGLALHQKGQGANCLFCDQAMPKDRLGKLEAHFSTEYEDLLRKLNNQSVMIQSEIDAASGMQMPNAAELYEDLTSEFEKAATDLSGERDSAKLALEALRNALDDKKNRVFERVTLDKKFPQLDATVSDTLNAIIKKHNQACDEFESRIASARKEVEADAVASSYDEFIKLSDAIQTADGEVTKADGEVKRIDGEITKLEREIVEHRQPAEELNDDLRNYLGHGELTLQVKNTGYTIMRHGAPAEFLSEGETTAIALLYFLKSLQDRRFDLSAGVVVLDDPVSSLDANALYSAFGFIRGRTQDAAQLFILTHNFAFFRQVRNWYHHLKGQNKRDISQRPARFYMLQCAYENGRRCASIHMLDPLLEQFDSEYHYRFACVHRASTASPAPPLEQNYTLPNLARRLLESFLAFRQPQIAGELWQKLQLVTFDEAKKIRIIRFLHTHSHNAALGEPEHDLSLLSEAQAILKDLLDLIESQDKDHFSAMKSLVAPLADEAPAAAGQAAATVPHVQGASAG